MACAAAKLCMGTAATLRQDVQRLENQLSRLEDVLTNAIGNKNA